MKNILILILILILIPVSGQNITELNADFKLADSLTYETEVRIYQGGGITNYASLLRMFKDKSKKWTAEFYEHYVKVNGQTELRIEKRILKSQHDLEFVFQNLIRSHIFDLPSLDNIQWKLVTRGNVEEIKRKHRDKEITEFELIITRVAILDGETFKVQIRELNRTNTFEFSNPDEYLKHFPEIDELIYMCEILNFIRDEFGIWKRS